MGRPRRRIRRRKEWLIVACEVDDSGTTFAQFLKWTMISGRNVRYCACTTLALTQRGYKTFNLAEDSIPLVREFLVDSGHRPDIEIAWGMIPPDEVVACPEPPMLYADL